MSSFLAACEESLKQKRQRRMDYGVRCYNEVKTVIKDSVGYLLPLRQSSDLSGPKKIEISDESNFKVGRGLECNLALQQDMFEEDPNLMFNKGLIL